MNNLTIQASRLKDELNQLATFSDTPAPAVTRVLFTTTELQARDYIRKLMHSVNLDIREDAVGNIFGRWNGQHPDLPPVATGSHIDAIPFSGMYDGTVGVLGAIEAIRALQNAEFIPDRSIEIIMFTAEEPTRFGLGCLGSRAMAGELMPHDLIALQDADNKSFDDVRQSAGYTQPLKTVALQQGSYHTFVELHIEQGKRLETSGNTIGIVTAIAAPATLRVAINGDGGHAGAVLMPNRRDVLPATAEIILAVEAAAKSSTSPDAVATVGLVEVYPNAVNSIPSRVLMEIDIRDIDLKSRDTMVTEIQSSIQDRCGERNLTVEMTVLNADSPCIAGKDIVSIIEMIAEKNNYPAQKLVSRAYHDALFMAQICPSSMIFVPSENGYSHRPEEFTSIDDIIAGVDVLAHTLAHLSILS